jgi:hypothetical protein
MKRALVFGPLGMAALFVAAACGGDLITGCPDDQKQCLVDNKPTCVSKSDPKYGCASTVCESCGTLDGLHVKANICDVAHGSCAIVCQDNYKNCHNSECVAISSDRYNCGDCSNECPLLVPNGQPACVMATCQAACNPGFADCDQQIGNGCECDLSTSKCSGATCVPGP